MDFLGGIEGMKFSPISNYNSYLKNNTSFDVDTTADFESVLNQKTTEIQNPTQIKGGIELNNFDDIVAQNSVQTTANSESAGNFMQSFSNSLNNGLTSVDGAVKAADRAQEAMAMGEDVSVHDVMIASEKASLSLQMAMQLRNKLMSAYTEINNVRV